MDQLCSVAECIRAITGKSAKGMCPMHYSRLRRLGSTDLPEKMQDRECSVPECEKPARKLDTCGVHYQRHKRYGTYDAVRRGWRDDIGGPCDWCGEPVEGRVRFCRYSCQMLESQNRRKGRTTKRKQCACVRCGDLIDMTETGKAGRRKREDVLMCDTCRRAKSTRHRASVNVLAHRDGTDCGICGDPVDMSVRMPDLMSASVDHIIPFAKGGSHDPSNLQLAHNICNRRKSARLPVGATP